MDPQDKLQRWMLYMNRNKTVIVFGVSRMCHQLSLIFLIAYCPDLMTRSGNMKLGQVAKIIFVLIQWASGGIPHRQIELEHSPTYCLYTFLHRSPCTCLSLLHRHLWVDGSCDDCYRPDLLHPVPKNSNDYDWVDNRPKQSLQRYEPGS